MDYYPMQIERKSLFSMHVDFRAKHSLAIYHWCDTNINTDLQSIVSNKHCLDSAAPSIGQINGLLRLNFLTDPAN